MSSARHLARRFLRALQPGPPRPADERWAERHLSTRERELFVRLPNHDRRHAIAVARATKAALAGSEFAGDARWINAALLHDVGKWDAHLGVPRRVLATLVIVSRGRDRTGRGDGATARYARHGELGADMIREAGGTDAAAAWAAGHHHPGSFVALALPPEVVAALDAADNL